MFRRFRNYPQIGGKRRIIPADCVEVEYLRATGKQYIDSGVEIKGRLVGVEAKLSIDDAGTSFPIGSLNTDNVDNFQFGQANSLWRIKLGSVSTYGSSSDMGVHIWKINRGGSRIDDEVLIESDVISPKTSVKPYLFARNNSGTSVTKYNCTIYNLAFFLDGVKYVDLVPVRRTTDGLGYMCDTLTGKLYGNQGTGVFVIGPDK